MEKIRYKAFVYLPPVKDKNGVDVSPCFSTAASFEKDLVLSYVKSLIDKGIIIAYRVLYSPTGEEDNYYNSEEVVYLEPDCRVVKLGEI